jgi:hypothetical protein
MRLRLVEGGLFSFISSGHIACLFSCLGLTWIEASWLLSMVELLLKILFVVPLLVVLRVVVVGLCNTRLIGLLLLR